VLGKKSGRRIPRKRSFFRRKVKLGKRATGSEKSKRDSLKLVLNRQPKVICRKERVQKNPHQGDRPSGKHKRFPEAGRKKGSTGEAGSNAQTKWSQVNRGGEEGNLELGLFAPGFGKKEMKPIENSAIQGGEVGRKARKERA